MAGSDNLLYQIDAVVIDGVALAIESGSGEISGAARYTNTPVLSASGDDYNARKRVATLFKANVQFGPSVSVDQLAGMSGVQITARDTQSGRRALMTNCTFAEIGNVGGGGAVAVTFNVLAPIQWL